MNQLENKIRKKLEDYQVSPPENLWDNIESRLENKKPETVFPFSRKFAAVAAAIVILFVSATFIFLSNIFDTTTQQISEQPQQYHYNPQTTQPTTPAGAEIQAPAIDSQSTTSAITGSVDQSSKAAPQIILVDATPNKELYTPTLEGSENKIPTHIANEVVYNKHLSETNLLPTINQLFLSLSTPELAVKQDQMALPAYTTDKISLADANIAITTAETYNPGRFSLSAYFAPQQSYRYQMAKTSTPLQSLESELITYTAGVNLNYRINQRWQLQSGIGYNRMGQNINEVASFSHPSMMPLYSVDGSLISNHPQSMGTSMGGIIFTNQSFYFADISSTRINTLKGSYDESNVNLLNKASMGLVQYFDYLELPVNVRYRLFDRGMSLYLKSGITASYLLSGNVFLQGKSRDKVIGKTIGVNTFNFMGTGGLVMSYPLTDKISVSLEPTASFFLTPMGNVRNLTRETHPYSFAVLFGFSYDLR